MTFLTVITRCFRRPEGLKRNIESLAMQTCDDWEQIRIPDPNPEGSGMLWANQQFYEHRDLATGHYIFLLDDDDHLTNPSFVDRLKQIAWCEQAPDVIVFRWNHKAHGVMPYKLTCWGQRPQGGHIGGSCFVVRREVWKEHIKEFGRSGSGDIAFIQAVWDSGARFYWHDEIMGEIPVAGGSRGRPE